MAFGRRDFDWVKYAGIALAVAIFLGGQMYVSRRQAELRRQQRLSEANEAVASQRAVSSGGPAVMGNPPGNQAPQTPPGNGAAKPLAGNAPPPSANVARPLGNEAQAPARPAPLPAPAINEAPPVRVLGQHLDLIFTARGAALARAVLTDVKVMARDPGPGLELLNEIELGRLSLALTQFKFGETVFSDLEQRVWELVKPSGDLNVYSGLDGNWSDAEVVYATTLDSDAGPLCRVLKTFHFARDSRDVGLEVKVENLSAKPATFEYALRGAAGVLLDGPPANPRQNAYVYLRASLASRLRKDTDPSVVRVTTSDAAKTDEESRRVSSEENVWASVSNRFFMAALVARQPEQVVKILVEPLAQGATKRKDKVGDLRYAEDNLSPVFFRRTSAELPAGRTSDAEGYAFFLGATSQKIIEESEASLGLPKPVSLHLAVQYCDAFNSNWPTVDRLSRLLLWIFNGISYATGSYGLAVILLTLVVKLALHPLQRKMTVSMHKMQLLQPRLKAIETKYEGQTAKEMKQKKEMEKWDLMRKEGVNPTMGCLPMLIQMPIFFALYGTFSRAYETRQAGFLWIHDLSIADRVVTLNFWPHELNLLPLIYIALTLWQSLTQPKPETQDPQQELSRKMMMFMPVVFGFLFYSMPSGLVLYFAASACLGMVETWYVRKYVVKALVPAPALDAVPATAGGRAKHGRGKG